VTGNLLVASVPSQNIMHSPWFTTLTMFVAINTVLYLTLAIIKLLPKAYLSDWIDQRNRRSESRSIYPDVDSKAPR
jgi:hypothetical protein